MKQLLHAGILSLIVYSCGLPALADTNDSACPEPPTAVYKIIGAISPMVYQMSWQEHETPAGFLVILHSDSPAPLLALVSFALGVCEEMRADWNPECAFHMQVIEMPWGGEAVTACEHR